LLTVWGKEGAGKTAFWQTIAGRVQKQYPNRRIVIIDSEGRFSGEMAIKNGMNLSKKLFEERKLVYLNPNIAKVGYEDIMVMLDQLLDVSSDGVFAIIDSLDAMMTKAEVGKAIDDGGASYGGLAKASSTTLKRVVGKLRQTNSNLLIVQQIRDKVGVTYGKKTGTSGGHSVIHQSNVRVELTSPNKVKEGDDIVGLRVIATLERNLYGTPYRECSWDLLFDNASTAPGIDFAGSLVDVAVELGIYKLAKGGNYVLDTGEHIKGRLNVIKRILEADGATEALYSKIQARFKGNAPLNQEEAAA
jgi:recombination protein RecA